MRLAPVVAARAVTMLDLRIPVERTLARRPVERERPLQRIERLLTAVVIAAALFAIAYDGGSYSLTSRHTIAIVTWWGLLLLVALGLVALTEVPRAAMVGATLFAAFAAVTGASAAWGATMETALDELGRELMYLGLFLVAVLAARRRDVVAWTAGLGYGLAAVAIYALAGRLLPWLVDSGPPLRFPSGTQMRLTYPVGYWTALGVLCALAVPLLLATAVDCTRPALQAAALAPLPAVGVALYLTSARLGVVVALLALVLYATVSGRRWAAFGAAVAAAAGGGAAVAAVRTQQVLLTGPFGTDAATRAGGKVAVAVAAACIFTGLAYATGRRVVPTPPTVPGRIRAAVALAALAAITAAAITSKPLQHLDAFQSNPAGIPQTSIDPHLLTSSSNGRWQLWTSAIDEFRSRPLLGRGTGSFERWWAQHGSPSFFVRNAHSLFLEQLGELGIVGALLIAAVFVAAFWAGARRLNGGRREPTAALIATLAAFVVAAGMDWMWQVTAVGAVGVLAAGLLTGRVTAGAAAEPARRSRRGAAVAAFAALTALTVAVLAVEAIPYLAANAVTRSQRAAAAGDFAAALAAARDAEQIEPWAVTPRLQTALVQEARGSLQAAETSIRRALRRDPNDWRLWALAARIETELGRTAGAKRSLSYAQRLNPRAATVSAY